MVAWTCFGIEYPICCISTPCFLESSIELTCLVSCLQHLDKTPNEYIQWRYAIGEDRESLSKTHRQATEEEEKLMAKQHVIDGVKRVVEKILSRRKLKNSYEYEVRFVNGTPDDDVWMKRTE